MVNEILNVFEDFRMTATDKDQYESLGKAILADKISPFVSSGKPIEFVMLGFPFKSTNTRDKVLGAKPDLGEELTMINFSRFNSEVKKVYSKGVNLTIATDGVFFNDLLGIKDETVYEYVEICKDMSLSASAPISWFDFRECYNKSFDLATARDKATKQFGITPEQLQRNILFDQDVNYLYRGMIRFNVGELEVRSFPSKQKLQNAAKSLTREMMLRNEAFSNLVKHEFRESIRLSMHPSINNGNKYSFQLIPSPKAKHSAWQACIALSGGEVATMHRKDAIAEGYEIVTKDGRPYFFTK